MCVCACVDDVRVCAVYAMLLPLRACYSPKAGGFSFTCSLVLKRPCAGEGLSSSSPSPPPPGFGGAGGGRWEGKFRRRGDLRSL